MGLAGKLISIFKMQREETEVKTDNKIELLVNELIGELKKDGKSIASPTVDKGFGSFTVFVHNLGTEYEEISLSTIKWNVKVRPTFKEF